MNQVALNGNIKSAIDPDFLHFKDEQTGVLLPSVIGYPNWLPQLQLTPSGRLCFWNFPAKVYKAIASNPVNQTTSQYLRDEKKVTSSNPYPPIPADLGTDGSSNMYIWDSCATHFQMYPELRQLLIQKETYRIGLLNAANPSTTPQAIINMVDSTTPPVGAWMPNDATIQDWIEINVQYYLFKYLKQPYIFSDEIPYGQNWKDQLKTQAGKGNLTSLLSGINFLVQPTASADFWTKVLSAAPLVILSAVAIIGTPLLVAAVGVAGAGAVAPVVASGINTVKKTTAGQTVANANQTAIDANRSVNISAINTDISNLTSFWTNATDDQKSFYIFLAVAVIGLIIYLYKSK